jgi:hypothetical protein
LEEKTSMTRNDFIHSKGFDMNNDIPVEYRKIKVGVKNADK